MLELTHDESKAIRKLQKVARTFPKSLFIFVGNGSFHILKNNDDGSPPYNSNGGVESKNIVATITGFTADGGDF
jgi:hypothetical protein